MSAASNVLVVEDDPVSRNFLRFALVKLGYGVATAEDATDAQLQLAPDRIRTFDCVVTDYRMPDSSGLELLAWIRERDPSLATILVTAEGEKHLVAESLRGGAVDFLDKPIDLNKLALSMERAVECTHRQRQLTRSETAVKDLGRTQARMLSAESDHDAERVEVCFHPKHEAGGDFFSRFRPAPDRLFCLLTDVSGHDLRAAYVSAYFQGVVRGMMERAAPVAEVFSTFNRLLLEEWRHVGAVGRPDDGIEASIAACAILIDCTAQTATVLAHGTPAPVFWRTDGNALVVGETGGFPLGWFPEFSAQSSIQSIAGGGSFCLWTDGLGDLAERQGVSALSLACALQEANDRQQKLPCLADATDDILLAVLHLSPLVPAVEQFRPLLCERYDGGQMGEIDELQSFWQRSLNLAAPELPESRLHDILLASREALLNALQHGCGGRADQTASFQAACCPHQKTVRVRVSDSGPGHQFDFTRHERLAAAGLIEAHRGLILIRHLANTVTFERNAACVVMDFDWL